MKYHNGETVALGDIVTVLFPGKVALGEIVILGDTFEHADIESEFLEWVKEEGLLDSSLVAVRCLGDNPMAHNDPRYAPVGDIFFTILDSEVRKHIE